MILVVDNECVSVYVISIFFTYTCRLHAANPLDTFDMPASPGCVNTEFNATNNDNCSIYDYADGIDICETAMDPSPHSTFRHSYESAEVHQNPGSLDNPLEGCTPSPEDYVLMEPKASSDHHVNDTEEAAKQQAVPVVMASEGARGVGQGVKGGGAKEEGEGEDGGVIAGGGEGQSRKEGLATDFDEEPKMKIGAYKVLLHPTSNSDGLYTSLKTQPHFD